MTPPIHPSLHRPRHRRIRNGKIARLPEPARDRVNRMIDDGFRYRDIIKALGPPGTPELPYSISEMNLSNWRKGGYRDYRRRRDQLEYDRAHPSPASIFLEHSRQFREKLAKAVQASRLPTDTSPLDSPGEGVSQEWPLDKAQNFLAQALASRRAGERFKDDSPG